LENGQQLFANTIVSNTDPDNTYLKMIGKENLSGKLLKKLNKTQYSCTSLMLFLTVDMDVKKAGLDSGNIWLMANKNTDDIYSEMMKADIAKGETFEGMFISCTTLKDPTSFDGKHHTIEAITYIDYRAFEPFEKEKNPRSKEYLKFKELVTNKMINGLEKVIPNIREHIVHKELGTPITNEFYVKSTRGNVYGTEKSLRHIGPFAFKAKSEIKQLYMCGASILSHGVAGASYSGVNTAALILGCKPEDLLHSNDSQKIQILEAEDNSDYPDKILEKIQFKRAKLASKIVSKSK